jgi:hypothetical protein
VVTNVDPAGKAAESGLKRGDVIQEVNHKPVRNTADFDTAMRNAKDPTLLLVNRQGSTMYSGCLSLTNRRLGRSVAFPPCHGPADCFPARAGKRPSPQPVLLPAIRCHSRRCLRTSSMPRSGPGEVSTTG